MYFEDLSKNLIKWQTSFKYPTKSELPDKIILTEKIRNNIKLLIDYTKSEVFSFGRKQGSLSWEFSTTIFYFGGDLIITSPKQGSSYSVMPILKISNIDHQISKDQKKVKFLLTINDKLYSTRDFPIDQWSKNKNESDNNLVGPVMVLHSHPKNYIDQGKFLYSFFSESDIKFLKNVNLFMLGLITEENIWIATKINDLNSFDFDFLSKVSSEELFAVNNSLNRNYAFLYSIYSYFNDSGLIFYYGRLSWGSVVKVNYQNFRNEINEYKSSKEQLAIKLVEPKYMSSAEKTNPKTLEEISSYKEENAAELTIKSNKLLTNQPNLAAIKEKKKKINRETFHLLFIIFLTLVISIISILIILNL